MAKYFDRAQYTLSLSLTNTSLTLFTDFQKELNHLVMVLLASKLLFVINKIALVKKFPNKSVSSPRFLAKQMGGYMVLAVLFLIDSLYYKA